jgi:hypothetical protein
MVFSVFSHVSSPKLLDEFRSNSVLGACIKTCREIFTLVSLVKYNPYGVLHETPIEMYRFSKKIEKEKPVNLNIARDVKCVCLFKIFNFYL